MDEDLELGPPGGICVPAIAAGGLFFAGAFGTVGAALQGARSIGQFVGQVVGATLGCFVAATMHKEEVRQLDMRRAAKVFAGALTATSLAFLALPVIEDLGIMAEVVLTTVGAFASTVLNRDLARHAHWQLSKPARPTSKTSTAIMDMVEAQQEQRLRRKAD
eukprot:TRINITY_DN10222_c0_g1_i2.p1 TRINITY_DN10222_c0_g1~~TRINITY_DN10222_c0_g1_i2.p1  ORF type:complete len:162 (-),score=28.92 TRINITY_DN10222_c0_g1_i2:249-734(-)